MNSPEVFLYQKKDLPERISLNIEFTEDVYGVKEGDYLSERGCVFEKITEVLSEAENPEIVLDNHQKLLHLLSYTDDYISTNDPSSYPISNLYTELGLSFNPIEISVFVDISRKKDRILQSFYDMEETKHQSLFFSDPASPISLMREKLGMTKEDDKPFSLLVTKLQTEEFLTNFHSVGFVQFRRAQPLMVLPYDASIDTKCHEWIHTQWPGIGGGRYDSLYRGVSEAFVESRVPRPTTYKPQRAVYQEISQRIPGFDTLVLSSGLRTPTGKESFLKAALKEFGLSGVNALSRMTPIVREDSEQFYSHQQRSVFMDIASVRYLLSS